MLTRSYPRRFTFYVADPSAPLKLVRFPRSLTATHRGFAFYVAFPKSFHSLDRTCSIS
jgi:hypothetical protein